MRGFDEKFKLLADYDLIIRLMLNNYRGIYFERNIMTCKLGEKASKMTVQASAECNHIYYKNYKSLYPQLTDDQINRMVDISEIPRPLLERFANLFPPDDQELFYERYEFMYNMRKEAAISRRQNERRNQ